MSKDQDKLLSSSYDGIQEYDNDLPKWWLYLFYATIIFGIAYTAYYTFGPGLGQEAALKIKMAEIEALKSSHPTGGGFEESTVLALVSDSAKVNHGKEVFTAKCVACHGPQGQGLVGPNLTDKFWIHGGKIKDIHNVIENGVLEKGMLAWKDQLSADDINALVAFIWVNRDSNPPNPKAPQGDPVE